MKVRTQKLDPIDWLFIVGMMIVSTYGGMAYEEETASKDAESKVWNNVHNIAADAGLGEFYLDSFHRRQFRWLSIPLMDDGHTAAPAGRFEPVLIPESIFLEALEDEAQ